MGPGCDWEYRTVTKNIATQSVEHDHCNDATYKLDSDVNGNIVNNIYSFLFVRFQESFSFHLGYTVLISTNQSKTVIYS